MKRFDVLDKVEVYEERGVFSDESYSRRPNTSTHHDVQGIYKAPYGDIVTNLDIKLGDTAILVYVIWSTGNSFGQDNGKYLTPIHLFNSMEKAQAAVDAIYAHAKNNDPDGPIDVKYNVTYIDNDGLPQSEYAGWIGYFESICDVRAETVEVIEGPDELFC